MTQEVEIAKAGEVATPIVLSIVTGRLLCPFGDLHEAIEKIAGEPIWTRQLGRVCQEIRRSMLRRLPALQEAVDETEQVTPENWEEWRDRWVDRYGPVIAVHKLSDDDHERIDPFSEAVEMGVHPDKIVTIKVDRRP